MSLFNVAGATKPREDLLGAYNEFTPDEKGFIAGTLFPDRKVMKRSGTYGVIPREVWLQRIDTRRAPDAESSTSRWKPESDVFEVYELAHKQFCGAVHSEEYEDWFNFEEKASRICHRIISIDKEAIAAAAVINETNFPPSSNTGATLSNEWDDTSSGTPVSDIETGKAAIFDLYGVEANALVLPYSGLQSLSLHPSITDRLVAPGYGSKAPNFTMRPEQLGEVFDIEHVLVPRVPYNAGSPGAASPTINKIWNEDYAFLTRIGVDEEEPQLGWTMRPTAHPGVRIRSEDQGDPEGTWIMCDEHLEIKLAADAVGYLIKNIKTA